MDWGSTELTNAILAILACVWAQWGWKMDTRLTRLETLHGAIHGDYCKK